jgi:xanthine/uracil permease
MTFLSPTMKILLTSGLLPAAFLAVFLNLILPDELDDDGPVVEQEVEKGAA